MLRYNLNSRFFVWLFCSVFRSKGNLLKVAHFETLDMGGFALLKVFILAELGPTENNFVVV